MVRSRSKLVAPSRSRTENGIKTSVMRELKREECNSGFPSRLIAFVMNGANSFPMTILAVVVFALHLLLLYLNPPYFNYFLLFFIL